MSQSSQGPSQRSAWQPAFKLSHFKLSIFRQCPRRYKYHYVDGLYQEHRKLWPHLTMGQLVHYALSDFLSQSNRDRSFPRMQAILHRRWNTQREGFKTPEQEKEYWERALKHLRWFYDTQDVRARPFMLEALHQVNIAPDLALIGKVDRVDHSEDGSFHVIDYKTGRNARGGDGFQLLAYSVLLGKKFKTRVSKVSYLFLNGLGWQSIEPTDSQLKEAEEQLRAARDEIINEQEYPPTPSQLCPWCDFAEICDAFGAEVGDYDVADEPPYWEG